jgi:hypothetical protein
MSEFVLLELVYLTRKYFRGEDNEREEENCGTCKREHNERICRPIHTAHVPKQPAFTGSFTMGTRATNKNLGSSRANYVCVPCNSARAKWHHKSRAMKNCVLCMLLVMSKSKLRTSVKNR